MRRRPASFPPESLDPVLRAALAEAIAKRERVEVRLRGTPETVLVGVPMRATPSLDGRARIAVESKDGATQQLVLVEHIVGIVAKRDG